MWEHPCVAWCGFNIFGARDVFRMDACHLFPHCMLAIIPLLGGVQMQWLEPSPGILSSGGSSCAPLEHTMGAEVAHDHSQSPKGQWWWLLTDRSSVNTSNHLNFSALKTHLSIYTGEPENEFEGVLTREKNNTLSYSKRKLLCKSCLGQGGEEGRG